MMTSNPRREPLPMPTREDRFKLLHEEHFESIRRYAWRRDPTYADDIVSETFLVAWRRIDEVPGDAGPWLFGVARHVRLNLQRGARRQQAVAGRLQSVDLGLTLPEPTDEAAELRRALGSLPERDREVLFLHAWEGLDRRQIGSVLGCSVANVSVRLHRARRRLADALAANARPQTPALVPSISGGASDVH
jgi:RNA polymerase sigma factor (sigma-70 family)